jgi:hypothetical protein
MTTLSDARNQMFERFWTDWQANTPAVNSGVVPEVRWQGDDSGDKPDASAAWARIGILHATAGQETFGTVGNRCFGRTGQVIIQIFAPLSRGEGLTQAEALAMIAQNAFEGKTAGPGGEIWFRDVVINEIGPDAAWFQFNVTATFNYDELK